MNESDKEDGDLWWFIRRIEWVSLSNQSHFGYDNMMSGTETNQNGNYFDNDLRVSYKKGFTQFPLVKNKNVSNWST